MRKFRNQFQPLAVSVSFWWLLVWESLQALSPDEEQAKWLTSGLLPVVYWHYKIKKQTYQRAWENASDTLKSDPFTITVE